MLTNDNPDAAYRETVTDEKEARCSWMGAVKPLVVSGKPRRPARSNIQDIPRLAACRARLFCFLLEWMTAVVQVG